MSIVMPTPTINGKLDFQGPLRQAARYPDRFAVLGGGGLLNPMIQNTPPDRINDRAKRIFEARATRILAVGARGFGEMSGLHFSYFEQHPYENAPLDHPLFLLLADIAARYDVPIDLHHELVEETIRVPAELRRRSSKNPVSVAPTIPSLEALLAHNRRARIVLAHSLDSTGHRTADTVRQLKESHPSLYMSLNVFPNSPFYANLPLKASGRLASEWKALVEEHPDRFVIGSDRFYAENRDCRGCPNVDTLKPSLRWLKYLSPETARQVAYENALRVYRLDREPPLALTGGLPRPLIPTDDQSPYLDADEIESAISGKTLRFLAPNGGRETYVHFAGSGTAIVVFADHPGGTVVKTWSSRDGSLLCRTVGPRNKDHCTRVERLAKSDRLRLSNPEVTYEAELLPGSRLPGDAGVGLEPQ